MNLANLAILTLWSSSLTIPNQVSSFRLDIKHLLCMKSRGPGGTPLIYPPHYHITGSKWCRLGENANGLSHLHLPQITHCITNLHKRAVDNEHGPVFYFTSSFIFPHLGATFGILWSSEMYIYTKRASTACTWCHEKKVRCDANKLGQPCTRCRQDSRECVMRPKMRSRWAYTSTLLGL